MKIWTLLILSFTTLGLISCEKPTKLNAERQFLKEVDYYINYIDSIGDYKDNFDFIYILSKKKSDTVDFIITLCGGPYIFLHRPSSIKNFLRYKGYNIVLDGDFPNAIIKNKPQDQLDLFNIVKKVYKEDYEKFKKDSMSVVPLIYDYIGLHLTYTQDKLITKKKQY